MTKKFAYTHVLAMATIITISLTSFAKNNYDSSQMSQFFHSSNASANQHNHSSLLPTNLATEIYSDKTRSLMYRCIGLTQLLYSTCFAQCVGPSSKKEHIVIACNNMCNNRYNNLFLECINNPKNK